MPPLAHNQKIIDKAICEYQNTQRNLKDICQELGIGTSTFYRYYKGPLRHKALNTTSQQNKGRKYKFNIEKIKQDSSDKYYWLGFIAADGSIGTEKRSLSIELKGTDEEHLLKFKNFLESENPIKQRVNNVGCHCSKLTINSIELVNYLSGYNIVPNKSLIYTIPLDKIPHDYIYDFARGLIDGDGSIQIQKDKQLSLYFCSGNKTCVEQMRDILGVDNAIGFGSGTYHFQVKGNHVAKAALDKIYFNSNDNNRLTRKYNIYKQTLN